MSILIAIIAIAIMIVVHEWGHFIAARICKLPVYEFAIGMGPCIWSHQGKRETKYSINLLPLGGYCAFDPLDAPESKVQNGIVDSALDSLPPLKRIFICAAGPLMNVVFALVIIFTMSISVGEIISATKVVDFMEENQIGDIVKIDDYIYSVDGNVVYNDRVKLSEVLKENKNGYANIVVLREGRQVELGTLTLTYNEDAQSYYLGIIQGNDYNKLNLGKAIAATFSQTFNYVGLVFSTLGGLFTGKYHFNELSSIVGVVSVMGDYAQTSTVIPFFTLVAVISINLGVMNILPIPVLDGSKIVYALIELVFKKPVNPKIIMKIDFAGYAVLVGLSFILILMDVIKLF